MLLVVMSTGTRADEIAPDELVKNISQDVLSVVSQDNAIMAGDRKAVLELVNAKVLPYFDFVRMTQLAVGKNWRKATPEQKSALVEEFRDLLVNSYTNVFTRVKNQTMKVMPVEISSGMKEVTVRTFILEPGKRRISIEYEMENTPGGWKVFDLTVEGVSLIVNYRSTFTREVDMGGIKGLIKTLVEKNAANNASH
jgi:phospholipid transport system substrate-binding protein